MVLFYLITDMEALFSIFLMFMPMTVATGAATEVTGIATAAVMEVAKAGTAAGMEVATAATGAVMEVATAVVVEVMLADLQLQSHLVITQHSPTRMLLVYLLWKSHGT